MANPTRKSNTGQGDSYVRHHAKASSAGSNTGTGNSRRLFGRASATRGASSGATGGGVPSVGRCRAALLAVAVVALSLFAPLALASKGGDSFIGTVASGTQGGQFNNPQDVAVSTAAGHVGQIYVVESSSNRIQRLSSTGTFERAWGMDVATGGATGTGTLNGTTTITSVVTTSKAFLVGQTITSGADIPAGTTITAVTTGAGAASTITLSQAATGSGSLKPLTVAEGGGNNPTNEIQTVTVPAAAVSGNFKLKFTATSPTAEATTANIPYNATPGEVQAALELLTGTGLGAGNVSVTSPNPGGVAGVPGGPYAVEFKGTRFADTNVATMTQVAGSPALSSGTATISTTRDGAAAFERCTVAIGCKAGVASAGNVNDNLGNGSMNQPQGVAIDQSTGNVYVTDRNNLRVNEYDSDGAFIRSWGQDVSATVNETQTITVDAGAGQYKLKFGADTTTDIESNAPATGAGSVQEKLNALLSISAGGGSVAVGGGPGALGGTTPYTVTFSGGPLAGANVGELSVEPGSTPLSGGASTAVAATTQNGSGAPTGFEVCQAAERCKIGVGTGTAAGTFGSGTSNSWRLNVTPPGGSATTRSVFVADPTNRRIERFNLDGTLDTTQPIIGSATQFEINRPLHLTVDANGVLYAANHASNGMNVQRYNTNTNTFLAPITDQALLGIGGGNIGIAGLEIDSFSGDLLLITNPSAPGGDNPAGDTVVREIASPGGATPTLADVHMRGSGDATLNGLGLIHTGAADRLYVSASGGAIGHRLLVLDNDGFAPITLNVGQPTNVGPYGATLQATINPNGPSPGGAFPVAGYSFEYSRNGVIWTQLAGTVIANPDAGTPQPVSANVSGLEANRLYRVRVTAFRAFNAGSAVSPELTFLTDSIPPTLQTLQTSQRTDVGAQLVGRLNPEGNPATYRFEYGLTTGYGQNAPAPDGSATGATSRLVFAQIEGLQPETTYHYRLVATNDEGTTFGDDKTFATRATVAPAGTRGFEMVTPPFKSVRIAAASGAPGNNSNPGVPSLDGESMLWKVTIFPLTDDVGAPGWGDLRLLQRTPDGWTSDTMNSSPYLPDQIPTYAKNEVGPSASGDLKTLSWGTTSGGSVSLLPNEGSFVNRLYTRRTGTGTKGFTPWLNNPDVQQWGVGFQDGQWGSMDFSVLNDSGTAMTRGGFYRGITENPAVAGDDDPSDDQQLLGPSGGKTFYVQQAETADALPEAPRQLVAECTGSGGGATLIPSRVGTGESTDIIGAQVCEESAPNTVAATGTGSITNFSTTLTSVTTETGAFEPGQIVTGRGIAPGTKIVSTAPNTVTLSSGVTTGAGGLGFVTAGSPIVKKVVKTTGEFGGSGGEFEVGQSISGFGIPGGTTILAVGPSTLTLSADATASSTEDNPVKGSTLNATGPGTVNGVALRAEDQHVTNVRGASVAPMGMSNDGKRIFFVSPDPATATTKFSFSGDGKTSCVGTYFDNSFNPYQAVGDETDCPPQLYVRQYDSNGNATVRWIGRAQGMGPQQIGELDAMLFEGASRDGRYVYFKTRSPLLPTDPNGGNSTTNGVVSSQSWDLYRYELPQSLDDDPSGGVLTRVSGGPAGNADPDTNLADGTGTTLRLASDDGKRAYFVTTSPIAGADTTGALGGITEPGGTVGNSSTRNLYLFDDTSGTPVWKFVARLPYGTLSSGVPSGLDSCASRKEGVGQQLVAGAATPIQQTELGCVHGTPSGRFITFFTSARLTADDDDEAGDVYLYDAVTDELVRVSASQTDTSSYVCNTKEGSGSNFAAFAAGECNADFGYSPPLTTQGNNVGSAMPGWAGLRYANISEDGDGIPSIYFESRSQLIPQDTNGTHWDVYQWRGGRLSLISRGDAASDSFFSGNSVDGRDVFIFTSDRIDPREIDDADFDIYDVRVGGGFPYTPPAEPCDVLAHECRGAPSTAPVESVARTRDAAGAGNVTPLTCKKGQVAKNGRCVKKKHGRKKHGKKKQHGSQGTKHGHSTTRGNK